MSLKIARFMFLLYHGIFASRNAVCRFRPTCSEYTLEAIESYGLLAGAVLSVRRLASCHPFSKRPFYDPLSSGQEAVRK